VVERHLRRLKGDVSQPRYNFRLVTRDGSIKWVEIGAVLIDWEGRPATLNFLNDITYRKQTEEELLKSKDLLSDTERIGKIGGWEFDAETLTQTWTDETFRILEIDLSKGEPKVPEGLDFITPAFRPLAEQAIQRAIEYGEPYDQEWEIITMKGNKRRVHAVAKVHQEQGKTKSVSGSFQDITERKQTELLLLIQRDLALAISSSHELDEALPRCLNTMLQLSEMDCGRIYLIDQTSGDLNLICHRNLSPAFIKSVLHYQADSVNTRLVMQGKPIFTRYSEFDLPLSEVRKAEKLRAFVVLPLSFEDRVIGCLNLASKKLEDVSEINRQVLKSAATLIGEGITRLKIEEELKLSYQKLQKAMKRTIQAMALILEKRDPYTAGHQKRVTELASAIAEEIRLSPDKIEGLYIAGIIHDIGKINVPTEILSKPGRLSEIEFSLIKTHPQVGSDILKEMELPGEISSIVLQHHERMDGSGYLSGLSGEAILLEARILAVTDVVEAMASHRPYRPALGLDKALEEITKNKGKLYDPEVVDACLKLFKEKRFKF
jgi:putative nucleotidyltransferase with HDIG domain